MVRLVYQKYLINGVAQMLNVFTTEYLMIQNQIEIENQGKACMEVDESARE